jgi:hypothetical protein
MSDNKVICYWCNKVIDEIESFELHNELLCDDCYTNIYFEILKDAGIRCKGCNKIICCGAEVIYCNDCIQASQIVNK